MVHRVNHHSQVALAGMMLFAKKLSVGPSTCDEAGIVVNVIDEQPIWFNMQLTEFGPLALECMVSILWGKRAFVL